MKTWPILLLTLFLSIFLVSACDDEHNHDEHIKTEQEELDDFINEINNSSYSSNYTPAPGHDTKKAAFGDTPPHGAMIQVFLNTTAETQRAEEDANATKWENGSIFVKNGYDTAEDTDVSKVVAMKRVDDGWLFAGWSGDVSADNPPFLKGKNSENCLSCHASEKGSDGVFAVSFTQE